MAGAASDCLEAGWSDRYVSGVSEALSTPTLSAADVPCLVVDDQERLRSALVRFLTGEGFHCAAAASGDEALAELERAEYPVMITDIQMPGMNGVTLLREVRRRWPDVAVIMVTGVDDVETAVSCLRLGAFDYITKPFQLTEIRARLAQVVEKRGLILENRRYQHHLADLVQQQASRIEELFLEGIQTLVHALEAKDPYTRGHSARVSAYSGGIARALTLPEDEVQLIELGAELHDVGKIGVHESVLNKPGPLTDDEYRHVMEHTVIGARILAPLMKNIPEAIAIVRSHHERLDGQGMPDGLSGERIPKYARIVSVADAFDAMTSGRSYRGGLGTAKAISELRAEVGRQFDGTIVDAFLGAYQNLDDLPIATPRIVRRQIPRGIAESNGGLDLADRAAAL